MLDMFGAGADAAAGGMAGGAVAARPFEDPAGVAAGAILQGMGTKQREAGLEMVKAKLAAGGQHAVRHRHQQ